MMMYTNWIAHRLEQLKIDIAKHDQVKASLREVCCLADTMAVDGEVDRHVKLRIAELDSRLKNCWRDIYTASVALENEAQKFQNKLLESPGD